MIVSYWRGAIFYNYACQVIKSLLVSLRYEWLIWKLLLPQKEIKFINVQKWDKRKRCTHNNNLLWLWYRAICTLVFLKCKSFHLQHWSRKKYIGSSACSNYMHIYMLTKLHCNIFYKHIIRLFGLTKQQLEGGFQTTGEMISCYSTCIIFVTYFFCDLSFEVFKWRHAYDSVAKLQLHVPVMYISRYLCCFFPLGQFFLLSLSWILIRIFYLLKMLIRKTKKKVKWDLIQQ